jgi:hypothetical protein
MTITTPICARIGCDTSVLKDGQLCSDCEFWMDMRPMTPVKPPAPPMPPVPEPKPAQFAMSNEELRRAIQDTSESITKLYNGDQKTALQKHLIALLDVERKRAEKITLDENTQR